MNKNTINTIIGVILIFGIFVIFYMVTKPSKDQIAKARKDDSIRWVMKRKDDSLKKVQIITDSLKKVKVIADTLKAREQRVNDSIDNIENKGHKHKTKKTAKVVANDTTAIAHAAQAKKQSGVGIFALSSKGNNKPIVLESDLLKLKIAPKGGFISMVQLKKYKTYKKRPLVLFDNDTAFKVNFYDSTNILYRTSDFYFEPFYEDKRFSGKDSISIKGSDSAVFCMRLYPNASDSVLNKKKYIEFRYVLKGNDYMVGFSINYVNMQDVVPAKTGNLYYEWSIDLRVQEKTPKPELSATTVFYKPTGDDVDNLSMTKDDENKFKVPVKWVSFKQQFFSSTIISKEQFSEATFKVKTIHDSINHDMIYLKNMYVMLTVPYKAGPTLMSFYFGPNQYKTLRSYHQDLERQIPLGWGFFLLQWINRFAVIPVFNWLESYGINYGIIILILTILLKILLFPIAYKTYKSSAKMRVLKPEVEEINKKFPKKEDAMKKQQATMALYKKAGVNPMSGCIPLLLQMPILIAMYRFFPASIELRQQPFLWADDLSSYDSVLHLGFNIPMYGDHVSLFCLLMTVSTVIYTWQNNQLMGTSNQMPGMKWMMYLMPIMFLGFFNNFASGLSYYYLLANLVTFLQMYLFRRFTDEEKIHAQIQENKKKPVKKSGFQARLEEMAKKRGYNTAKR